MAIPVKCPNPACGKEFNLKTELAGKVVKCDACGQAFRVPGAQPPSVRARGASASGGQSAMQSPAVPLSPEPRALSPDPLIGSRIAHYRIESLLGKGGMGKVYKAKNLNLAKTCAIKVLPPEFSDQDASLIERFIREARSAASVEHPNVLPVHFVGKVEQHYFIEMQYVDGGTLQDLLTRQGRLMVGDAVRIVRDVALALQAAHEKGIVHRDMKPSNVMLTQKGQVFVADFGLAKTGQATTGLTLSGTIVGTPLYMSPEQCQAKPLDHRSDIYSLGVMFYQMLAAKPPYYADEVVALISQHVMAPVPDVRAVAPDVPAVVSGVIMKMMAKDPAQRYQSCGEVAADMNRVLAAPAGGPGALVIGDTTAQKAAQFRRARLSSGRKKRSAPPVVLSLVLLLALVLGAGLYLVKTRFTAEPQRPQRTETATAETAKTPSTPKTETDQGRVAQAPSPVQAAQPPAPAPAPTTGTPAQRAAAPVSVGAQHAAPLQAAKQPPAVEKQSAQPFDSAFRQAQGREQSRTAQGKSADQSIDLLSYLDDIKPVNDLIDKQDYASASARANLLKGKYAGLIKTKCSNIDRIVSLRKRCFDRVNSGAAKLMMSDVSKRYAFAGEIKQADETGLTAAIKKGWDAFSREEVANFYRKAADPASAEDQMAVAGFLMEGTADAAALDAALNVLGQAAGFKADVSAQLKHIETLKQAQKEYADAAEKGKVLETATAETTKTQSTQRTEQKEEKAGKENEESARQTAGGQAKSADKSFDDVYVATAASGDSPRGEAGKIPHPLSKKTTKIIYQGKRVDIPEGFAYVPAGKFKMGENESEHEVYLDAYFIGKYEVTNAEWKVFLEATRYKVLPSYWKERDFPQGRDAHPIAYVAWEDAQSYCDWVSTETGRGVRLPTEAQWEKAARGPKAYVYPWGNTWDKRLCNNSLLRRRLMPWEEWIESEEGKNAMATGGNTTPVGSFPKGKSFYGCLDMAGNVGEWCSDWFMTKYYKLKDAKKNPQGPSEQDAEIVGQKGKCRSARGGAWPNAVEENFSATNRAHHKPTDRMSGPLGFRLVVSAE